MTRIHAAMRRVWKDAVAYRGFILAFLVYDIAVLLLFHNFCPSVFITGLPCPGCGVTRSIFYYLTGQFEKGWAMNPLGVCWLALIVYFCLMRYWFDKKPKGIFKIGGVLAVCMGCMYIVRMIREFPGSAPIMYTEKSILEKIIPEYREWIDALAAMLMRLRAILEGDC